MARDNNPHNQYVRDGNIVGIGDAMPGREFEKDRLHAAIIAEIKKGLPESTHLTEDLWKHKATGMRCHTCMYFVPKDGKLGRCRRHAPTMSGFPVVFDMDFCGDHKLDKDISK